MKRLLATFVLAVVAGTTIAATVTHLVSKDGGRFGQSSVTFQVDGVDYVLTDEATLDRIEQVIRPQLEVEMQQARLGAEQAKIGARQSNARGAERDQLAQQQVALAEQQLELAKRYNTARAQAEKELENIFREAVRTGVARRR